MVRPGPEPLCPDRPGPDGATRRSMAPELMPLARAHGHSPRAAGQRRNRRTFPHARSRAGRVRLLLAHGRRPAGGADRGRPGGLAAAGGCGGARACPGRIARPGARCRAARGRERADGRDGGRGRGPLAAAPRARAGGEHRPLASGAHLCPPAGGARRELGRSADDHGRADLRSERLLRRAACGRHRPQVRRPPLQPWRRSRPGPGGACRRDRPDPRPRQPAAACRRPLRGHRVPAPASTR